MSDPENGTSTLRQHPVRWFVPKPGSAQRQAQSRDATRPILAILDQQTATVSLGNLPADHEPDPGTAGLRREERHEQVCGVAQTGPFVLEAGLPLRADLRPPDVDTAFGFQC